MKKILSLVFATAIVLATFSGCSGSSKNNQKLVVSACVGGEPQSIDPAINQSADGATYLVHAFEGLMKVNKKLGYDPGIAESQPTVSKDGLTWTFKLRSDAKWSDGKAVTAGDFVYAWQRAVNPSTASAYAYQLYYIVNANEINSQYVDKNGNPAKVKVGKDGKPTKYKYDDKTKTFAKDSSGNYIPDAENGQYVEDANGKYVSAKADGSAIWLNDLGAKATDDTTLVVTLAAPCPYFTQIAAFPTLFPVRKDVVEKNPSGWTNDPSTYITDGPYKLSSWVHKSKLVFVKNPYYYDTKSIGPDELDFSLMDDNNAIYSAYKNKTIEVDQGLFPQEETPKLIKSGDCTVYPSNGNYYYAFNTTKKPFDNVKVREALTLAIDRQYIVDNITKGEQVPAGAFVPLGMQDVKTGSDFRKVGGNFYDPTTAGYKANVTKAKQLLAEAGYPDGKGFPTFELKYNTNTQHQAIAEYVTQQWKTNLGINASIVPEDFPTLITDRNTAKFDVARDAWVGDYNDPMTFMDISVTGGGNNDTHYSNAKYDALIKEAKATSDQAKRMSDMHEAEKILMNDYAVMPIYFRTDLVLCNKSITGVVDSPLGYLYLMWTKTK